MHEWDGLFVAYLGVRVGEIGERIFEVPQAILLTGDHILVTRSPRVVLAIHMSLVGVNGLTAVADSYGSTILNLQHRTVGQSNGVRFTHAVNARAAQV